MPTRSTKPTGGASFEDQGARAGKNVRMTSSAIGLDGATVTFVLERENAPGQWAPIGGAATVLGRSFREAASLSHTCSPE